LECLLLKNQKVDGNIVITWKRRTRKDGAWKDYADVPLSENTEAYEIEVLDKDNKVLRTTAVSQESYTYDGTVAGAYKVKVYQISEVRGRGIEAEIVI